MYMIGLYYEKRYIVNYCKVFLGEEIPLVMCFIRVCLDS